MSHHPNLTTGQTTWEFLQRLPTRGWGGPGGRTRTRDGKQAAEGVGGLCWRPGLWTDSGGGTHPSCSAAVARGDPGGSEGAEMGPEGQALEAAERVPTSPPW